MPKHQRSAPRPWFRRGFCVVALGVSMTLGTVPARGHHSPAGTFDSTKPIKVTGSVTRIEWGNPHALFFMDVRAADGKVANWGWELPSPNQLMRAGWLRDSLKIGDVITVEGSHARDGTTHGLATTVTMMSTGKRLFSGQADQP